MCRREFTMVGARVSRPAVPERAAAVPCPPPRAARLMRTSRALWGAQLGGGGASRPWVWAAASRGLPSDERRPGARGACLGARAAGWYGLMPAAPLLGRLSKPRTVHRERIGAIEQGGNSRGCEAPLCVPFLLLVYGASGDRRAVMSDLLKLLLHDTVNSNPLDFAAPVPAAAVVASGSASGSADDPEMHLYRPSRYYWWFGQSGNRSLLIVGV